MTPTCIFVLLAYGKPTEEAWPRAVDLDASFCCPCYCSMYHVRIQTRPRAVPAVASGRTRLGLGGGGGQGYFPTYLIDKPPKMQTRIRRHRCKCAPTDAQERQAPESVGTLTLLKRHTRFFVMSPSIGGPSWLLAFRLQGQMQLKFRPCHCPLRRYSLPHPIQQLANCVLQ